MLQLENKVVVLRFKLLKRKMMSTTVLLEQIFHLPVYEQMLIVEQIIHSIREENIELENAATEMADEYSSNKELTAFTQLDIEDFYEAR
jgi:hypothetical protein